MSASAILFGHQRRPPNVPSYRRHHGCNPEDSDCLECDFARELTQRLMAVRFNERRKAILRQVSARIDQDAIEVQQGSILNCQPTEPAGQEAEIKTTGDVDNGGGDGQVNQAVTKEDESSESKFAPQSKVEALKKVFEEGGCNKAHSKASSQPVIVGFVYKKEINNNKINSE